MRGLLAPLALLWGLGLVLNLSSAPQVRAVRPLVHTTLAPSPPPTAILPSFNPTSIPQATRVLYKVRPSEGMVAVASTATAVEYAVAAAGPGESLKALAQNLSALATTEWVALDEVLHVHALRVDSVTPDDPDFPEQWGLEAVHAPEAWATATGAPTRAAAVTVCIVDSGIDYDHEDLAANMAAAVGVSMLPGSPGPMDELGHGSHVAGIVGAAGSNALLVSGVVWGNVDLLACRFIDGDGLGRTSAAVDCVNYCLAQGARVIQASWGGAAAPNAAMQAAMEAAEAADALIVVSAGNDDRDLDAEPQYPASYAAERANVLAVAAVGRAGALSSFSNRGAGTVALAAPGEAILSTLPGNATGVLSGTSMAAPFVSGAAALALSVAGPGALPAPALKRLLLESAEPTAQLRGRVGAGLLRLDRVVAAAAALAAAPTTAP
ncbi:hypothetical protein ACKKBG_A32645 [Auxenochlorella protothecoides x Auxenochlorella symbiontica]